MALQYIRLSFSKQLAGKYGLATLWILKIAAVNSFFKIWNLVTLDGFMVFLVFEKNLSFHQFVIIMCKLHVGWQQPIHVGIEVCDVSPSG